MKKSSKDLGISQKFSLIRKHFGLSADALGEKAGVSGTAIANIEKGESLNPGAEMLASISTMLGVNLNWLLLGEGEMLKPSVQDAEAQKKMSYMPSGLFPKEAPLPDFTPAEMTELHGQIIHTRLPSGMGTPKPAPKKLPGQDFVETVARHDEAILQLTQQLAELRERVEKG